MLAEEWRGLRHPQKSMDFLINMPSTRCFLVQELPAKKAICVNVCFFHSSVLVDPLRLYKYLC